MALDIVYGYQGKDHVKASQLARLLSGTIGGGRYVLDTQDGLKATMQTANKVRIGTGDLVMDGRYITNEAYQELTVASGQSGYNRNDIVGVQYTRASGSDVDHSVETPTLKVLKGTQTTGSASDPSYTAGDIAAGDASAFMPLWRLPITGLNVGTPVKLFEKIAPYNEFRDSVSRIECGRTENINVPGGSYKDYPIVFSKPFESTARVVCSLATQSTAPTYGDIEVGAINATEKGFTIRIWNNGNAATPAVNWIATA